MITRHLIFPESIGSYYFFSQTIAAVSIDAKSIRVIIITASGNTRKVQRVIEEQIPLNDTISHQEQTTIALRHILERIPKNALLIAILPSSSVVHKTISVPMMSLSKLKQLIPFEIEPLIPFPLNNAYIDSIIVGKNEEKKEVAVLVAATRQDILKEYLTSFEAIGKQPDHVTTDVIALCALVIDLSQLNHHNKPFILVHIEQTTTIILLVEQDRINHIRTLSLGINQFYEDNPANSPLLVMLQTTLTNYLIATPSIVISGIGASYPAMCPTLNTMFGIPCTSFTINKILHDHNIRSEMSIGNQFLIPLATALPTKTAQSFDINVEHGRQITKNFIGKQTILASILLAAIFTALISIRMITVRQLRSEVTVAEQETIKLLTSELKLTLNPGSSKSLDVVMSTARAYVNSQEKIWFALSSQHRAMPLKALEELSRLVDRKELNLQLQKLSINEADGEMIMTLTGSVSEFNALDKLQDQIRTSSQLHLLEKIPNTSFVAKINVTADEGT